MTYYKILKNDGTCANGGLGKWYLPKKLADGTWKPGRWMPKIDDRLIPCEHGYHLCRPDDLIYWLDEAIFVAEFEGEMVLDDNKIVVRRARLLRKVETWNERTARLFACKCAEHVLPIFEKKYPDDTQPRKAVEIARKYANGKATKTELAAARDAARDAAWDAAWDAAARAAAAAAADAAWDAAWAAEAAARAAEAAAEAAARAAADAAWAARYAARDAWAAARDAWAAGVAEREWQTKTLLKMIGEV